MCFQETINILGISIQRIKQRQLMQRLLTAKIAQIVKIVQIAQIVLIVLIAQTVQSSKICIMRIT